MDALAAQGRDARIPAQDYTLRLRELATRKERAENALAKAEELTEQLAQVEADSTGVA